MKKQIIVLEDDPLQGESIVADLSRTFPDLHPVLCPTECEFRNLLDNTRSDSIACVIMDAMVPWDFPRENMSVPPAEVQTGGMFQAAKRCVEYLRKKHAKPIPVCVHTILDRDDAAIEEDSLTRFVSKKPSNGELVDVVRQLLALTSQDGPSL